MATRTRNAIHLSLPAVPPTMKSAMVFISALFTVLLSLLVVSVEAEPSYLRANDVLAAAPPVVSTHLVLQRSLQDVNDNDHSEGEEHTDEEHGDEDQDGEEHYEGDGHDHENEEEFSTTTASSSVSSAENKPWGQVIGFALLINVATLVGLFTLIPALMAGAFSTKCGQPTSQNSERTHYILHNIIPSFACGALLATTVFLLLPEAILLIATATGIVSHHEHRRELEEEEEEEEEEDNSETQLAWKFGTSLLGGYLIPVILGSVFPHDHQEKLSECPLCEERKSSMAVDVAVVVDKSEMSTQAGGTTRFCAEEGCCSLHSEHPREEEGAEESGTDHKAEDQCKCPSCVEPIPECEEAEIQITPAVAAPKQLDMKQSDHDTIQKPINYKLAASILLGDAFHNFADGIFLGTAFSVCSRAVAYSIVAATIYHELAQELADYFLLTTHVGLPPWKALTLNFCSGLSVMLGAIIILALDVSQMATGCILAISAGVYIYIAASEIAPRIEKEMKRLKDRAVSVLFFALGAIPIGLVLLTHGHCDA